MARKTIKDSTDSIRSECDDIDEAVDDKKAKVYGDPLIQVW